jgi:adenine-specific DNA-methyltransferase
MPKKWTDPNPEAKRLMLETYSAIRAETQDIAEIQQRFRTFIRQNREKCVPLTHYDRIDKVGPYTGSREVHNPGREGYRYDVIHPVTGKPCKEPARGYRYPEPRLRELISSDRIIYGEDESQIIQIKEYLKDYEGTLKSVIHLDSRVGANTLEAIFGNRETFRGPKPVELLKMLISFTTSEDDIILDSFAGSGTTAQAVLGANQEDGGQRRFILVQMRYDSKDNEGEGLNICETITAERVRRVMQGYAVTRKGRDGAGRKDKVEGLGGTFTYACVGSPLFGEYRDLGKRLPAFEEFAKYIFYTETSRDFDRTGMNEKTGRIGEHGGTSYYLLYTPNDKQDRALDLAWLQAVDKTEKNRNLVVYCEKIWVHRDDLAKYEMDTKRTVRPMLVPFNLK